MMILCEAIVTSIKCSNIFICRFNTLGQIVFEWKGIFAKITNVNKRIKLKMCNTDLVKIQGLN